MLDGLQYVIAQIAVIVAVAAILAGILGWLVGRASGKRRAANALASTQVSRLHPAPAAPARSLTPAPVDAPPGPAIAETADYGAYAPAALVAEPFALVDRPVDTPAIAQPAPSASVEPAIITAPADAVSSLARGPVTEPATTTSGAAASFAPEPVPEAATPVAEPTPILPGPVVGRTAAAPTHGYGEGTHSFGEATRGYGEPTHGYAEDADDEDDDEDDVDPDRTVLRPAPSWTAPSKTPQYAPPRFTVVSSTLPESALVQRTASVQEVQELRRELRIKELELGKLEAGALSAWDRTVPRLEAEIIDLQDENAALRRTIRDAQEHSDADAQTVERLRASIAERDARLADLRAQG